MDTIRFKEGKNVYKKVLQNVKYDLKQDIVISGHVQSLQHILITNIAIMLFQYDLRDDADKLFNLNQSSKYSGRRCNKLLNLVESKVLAKSSSFILTLNCKNSLKLIINAMTVEIKDFFSQHLDFFILSDREEKEKILIYYTNLCWTQEGKINTIKTMTNIIENSNFDLIDKYILACDNCLEDKIQNLLKIMPENLIDELIKADNAENERKRIFVLVTFWTYHFRGKQEKFSELINGEETYEYLLNWTIENNKKIAWHYFWENFADAAMKNKNLKLVNSNEYISLPYLFTQFNHDDIEVIFIIPLVCTYFLNLLDRISKSCKIVLVPYYILDYMKTHNVCDSFALIIFSWLSNCINTIEYIEIWEDFIHYINKDNLNDFIEMIHSALYSSIIIIQDWQTVNLLLKFSTYKIKKAFLYDSIESFPLCKGLLVQGPNHFNKIIKLLLISEEEILKFKNILFSNSKFEEIIYELIINDKFENLKEILFMFCSTEEIINKYKNELPFKNNASILLKILKCFKDSNLLNLLNKFISWCYDGNDEEITRCKAIIFDLKRQLYVEHKYEFFKNFKELIRTKKWTLLDKYLIWIFFATKDKIDSTEKKIERIKIILNHTSRNDYCLLLTRFIKSCFDQSENDDSKEVLSNNIILVVVQNLSNLDSYEEVNNLLDWRFSSDKNEIAKFKDLFMSNKGCEIVLELIQYRIDIVKIEALFKWFNPSLGSANIFKEGFKNYIINKVRLQLDPYKSQNKRGLLFWETIILKMNQILALLFYYVEETNLIEKEVNIIFEDDTEENDKERENEEVLFEKRKKVKL